MYDLAIAPAVAMYCMKITCDIVIKIEIFCLNVIIAV